jgi:hypothetical protein
VRLAVALVALVLALGWVGRASAHEVGLSRGDYTAKPDALSIVLALSHRDALALLPGVDADADGKLAPAELDAAAAASAEKLPSLATVSRDGHPCNVGLVDLRPDQDGIAIELTAKDCAGASFVVDVRPLIAALPAGHRHAALLHAPAGSTSDALLYAGASELVVAAPGAPAPPPLSRSTVAARYLGQGIVHIFGGADHVVFLLGLLLVGGRLRHVLAMVTAFTVSHSVTLGLAVLGVVAPRPSIIEPLIALSVAYVGVENFLLKDAAKRWRVTGVFGLIHGFGFAGALGEVGVPADHVPLALATFNVGVEIGQLCIIGVAFPLFHYLRKMQWVEKRGVQLASVAIIVAGLLWFIQRVLPAS